MALVRPVDDQQTWLDVMNEFPEFKELVIRDRKTLVQKQRQKQKQFIFDESNNYLDEFPSNFNHFDINENLYKTLAENEALNLANQRRLNDIYGLERYSSDSYQNEDPLADLQMQESNSAFQRMKPNLCDPNIAISG